MNLNFRQKKLQIITENVGILKCFLDFKAGTQSKSFGINEQKNRSNDLYDHDCFYAI